MELPNGHLSDKTDFRAQQVFYQNSAESSTPSGKAFEGGGGEN